MTQKQVNPWLIAFAVMFATFMEVLDTTVVNVSLPHIASSLSATTDEATWALTSYLVANAIILPSWTVTAVACVPGGAHPSYAHGYYARDNAYYKAWDAISRERETFLSWMTANVLEKGPEVFAQYGRRLQSAAE